MNTEGMTERMTGIDKVVDYIKSETAAECLPISESCTAECRRLREVYFQAEQDAYWKVLGVGTKEAEQRLGELSRLAATEANRQIDALQQEMVGEAFSLAAEKLRDLPPDEFTKLLSKINAGKDNTPDSLVASFREELSHEVSTFLFE